MVPEFLKRAAEKTGHKRERYIDKNIPTGFDNIAIMLFYGDMRSEFVMSSFLLHRIKQLYPSRYMILCSYPGRAGIYPSMDEYWSIQDNSVVGSLANNAVGFDNNNTEMLLFQERQINRYFENVIQVKDYYKYYRNGFNKQFFDDFKWIVYNLPAIPSTKIEFNRILANRFGHKVMVYPAKTARGWSRGKIITVDTKKNFWLDLLKELCKNNFVPVIYSDAGSYEIEFDGAEQCREHNVLEMCGAMRTTGCVLDVFSGISRFAGIARTPFVSCVERHLYNALKEYEIDDLCNSTLPYRYIFSFPTIINSGHWGELISSIVNKLQDFIPELNRDRWPSTTEQSFVVPYSAVREVKRKKIGTRFIKVQHLGDLHE